MTKLTFALLLTLGMCISLQAQRIDNLFTAKSNYSKNFSSVVATSQALSINKSTLSAIRSQKPAAFTLQLPFEQGTLSLDLKKVQITADNFSVLEALPGGQRRAASYEMGSFYQGKVDGRQGSMATISIVGDQVMGVISDDKSNIVLGAIEENGRSTDEYTLYRQSALKVKDPFSCYTSDDAVGPVSTAATSNTGRGTIVGAPIDIYFECDYKLYTDKGSSVTNVINYVLGFFNNVALLYEVEDVKVQVSQILVWTTQDPEAAGSNNTTSTVLNAFSTRMNSTDYIGDYAHFLTTRSLGGGIAWLTSVSCISKYYRTGVSAIYTTYNNYPTYSWTVECVTHELGHNLGSNHTQWCGWPGGALDNCYPTEPVPSNAPACGPGPAPVNGGTIMSYCHLVPGVGINFTNGFGELPGNKIRSYVAGAACFATCSMTINLNKVDASCGQNNGNVAVVTSGATGAVTYEWSNGQTGSSLVNAAPGTYHVTVKDAAGCQVMKDVVIANTGTTLAFTLTPSGSAGFCPAGNVVLTATNNPAYTYAWTRNGVAIAGATSNTYTASVAGNYVVTATAAGGCTGSQSVTVTQVAAPTATITASGATTFCAGEQVTLNAGIGSSYSYQWYRDGVAIAGATGPTYQTGTSGSYTVTVSAGTNCSVTSTATVVTVNPVPAVNVEASGLLSFCSGENVILTTPFESAYTYTWTRNGTVITGANQSSLTVTTAGVYRVIVTAGPCSVTSPATTVTVFPTPVVTVTPTQVTIEKFATATLTVTGAPNYDLASLPYQVSTTANSVTVRPPSTTTYNIRGYDANGCEGYAAATVYVIGCGQVTNIDTSKLSPSRVLLTWTNPQDVTTDTVQYRKVGTNTWTNVLVTGSSYEINGLEPGSAYEFNVIPLCSTTTTFLRYTNGTIATDPLLNDVYLRLFPNPVSGSSRLEVISATGFSLQYDIYDFAGRLIARGVTGTYNAGQVIVPVEGRNLAAGIYQVAVRVNGDLHTIKMMVAH